VFWLNYILVRTQYVGNAKKVSYYDSPPMKIICILRCISYSRQKFFHIKSKMVWSYCNILFRSSSLTDTLRLCTSILNFQSIRHKCVTFKMHKQIIQNISLLWKGQYFKVLVPHSKTTSSQKRKKCTFR
jgi:hypothetical protein